ncbi:MAG: aminoacyltransferase, partial [Erysipelotrichaceae bacterium]|nr:aminoacyltransferase [Erysipelotrichaceae bacterium]
MKIKEFKNLNEYKEFVESSKYNHYMKSISWGNIKKSNKLIPIYLGFYEDETLIGSALIFFVSGIVSYMYIPTGLCIDYHNEAILNEALDLLKKYAIKHKVAFLRIDPNIIRISKDINGNPTNDINNENITNLFIKSGFKHKGYGYGYDGSWHNRFTLIVDIDKDINIIKSNYTKQRQTAINRHNIIGLNTRIGSIEEINYLCEFEKELSKTQGFKPHSKDFFENIITNFKENSRLYITEINLDQMIEGISKELLSKKYAKDKEAKSSKEKELKEAKLLKETYGPNLVLA